MNWSNATEGQEHDALVVALETQANILAFDHPYGWPKPKYPWLFGFWRKIKTAIIWDTPEMVQKTRALNRSHSLINRRSLPRNANVWSIGSIHADEDGQIYKTYSKRRHLLLTDADLSARPVWWLRAHVRKLQKLTHIPVTIPK